MKKIRLFSTILFALLFITSCNSVESDAKKAAELQCKAMGLMMKEAAGDMSVKSEYTKLASEAGALAKKYTSEDDKKKFNEIYSNEMRNCKN